VYNIDIPQVISRWINQRHLCLFSPAVGKIKLPAKIAKQLAIIARFIACYSLFMLSHQQPILNSASLSFVFKRRLLGKQDSRVWRNIHFGRCCTQLSLTSGVCNVHSFLTTPLCCSLSLSTQSDDGLDRWLGTRLTMTTITIKNRNNKNHFWIKKKASGNTEDFPYFYSRTC